MPVVVIDADINKRLASELKKRGRDALATSELLIAGLKDAPLLQHLHDTYGRHGYVLLTGDDKMPFQHADVVAKLGCTIATVDPHRGPGYEPDERVMEWRKDVGHRWFHIICVQPPETIYRYGIRKGVWKARLKERSKARGAAAGDAKGLRDPRPTAQRLLPSASQGGKGQAG